MNNAYNDKNKKKRFFVNKKQASDVVAQKLRCGAAYVMAWRYVDKLTTMKARLKD